MIGIHVTSPDGGSIKIEAEEGATLMNVLRDNDIEGVEALCGGTCTCSTCHVWIEPSALDLLPAPSAQEVDVLELSEHHQANSRLSCQIQLSPGLDGLCVTIAPSD